VTTSTPPIVIAPVIGLALDCLTHVVASRVLGGRRPYPALVAGAIVGIVATMAITAVGCIRAGAGFVDCTALLSLNTVVAAALAFGYFNFVNLTIASLRIRILEELVAAGGRLPRSTLLGRYGTDNVVSLRLERLVGGGHLVERNGRLHIGRLHFLVVARIFDGLRWIVFGRPHPTHPHHTAPPARDSR